MLTENEKEVIRGKVCSAADVRILIQAFRDHPDLVEIADIAVKKALTVKKQELKGFRNPPD